MTVPHHPEATAPHQAPARTPRAARVAVTAAYPAQGLGYAVVVTSLPALKARQQIDDATVSLLVLGVCVTAALGSVIANVVAVRFGSRAALVLGLVVQACALPVIAVPTPFWAFAGAFGLYGVGLGCVDAAATMQGVLLQRRYGRSLLGGLFAAYTAAAIVGALLVSGVLVIVASGTTGAGAALGVTAVIGLTTAAFGIRSFAREVPAGDAVRAAVRGRLPRAGIWVFGLVILAVFTADSAISTWSTVYLQDVLSALPWIAPLGYAAYQISILVTRLATDRLLPRLGRRRLVLIATIVSMIGCVGVAVVPLVAAAVIGFALTGVAVGVLVPVTFGAAGELDPDRSDQVIARVNIFNYAGAVLGAVGVGLLADGPGLGIAFLIPAVALGAALLALPRFSPTDAESAATELGESIG